MRPSDPALRGRKKERCGMKLAAAIVCVLGVVAVPAAQAQDAGDWIWRVGVHNVRPKSDNHDVVNVDTGASLTFNGTYIFAPHWGVELLAAMPFSHDINLNRSEEH